MNAAPENLSAVSLQRYDDLLHCIYSAALEPGLWQEVIAQIAALWRAPRALLYSFSLASGAVGFSFAHNISERELQIYAARSATSDPFVEAAKSQGLLTEGSAHVGHDLVPMSRLITTDFYRDIWQPLGISQLCTGIVFDGTDSCKAPSAISLYRAVGDPPFTETDRVLLQRLVAHLSRSIGVMLHLRERDLNVAATAAAFDRLSSGVILLAQDLCVVHMNKVAQAMVLRQSPLRLVERADGKGQTVTLPLSLKTLQPRFDAWLHGAAQMGMSQDVEHFSNAFVLEDGEGLPSCVLHAAPIVAESAAWSAAANQPRIVVLVYDLTEIHVEPGQLRRLFALTPAEANAALQVLQGGSVAQMASRLDISVNTFKSQLAAAYEKTMTHRQTDLLKLLLSLSAR